MLDVFQDVRRLSQQLSLDGVRTQVAIIDQFNQTCSEIPTSRKHNYFSTVSPVKEITTPIISWPTMRDKTPLAA